MSKEQYIKPTQNRITQYIGESLELIFNIAKHSQKKLLIQEAKEGELCRCWSREAVEAASAFKCAAGPNQPSSSWASSLQNPQRSWCFLWVPIVGAVTEVPSYYFVYLKVPRRSNLTMHTRIGAANTSGTHGERATSSAQQTGSLAAQSISVSEAWNQLFTSAKLFT